MSNNLKSNGLKLYGKLLNFSTLQLQHNDLDDFESELNQKFKLQADSKIPVVVDAIDSVTDIDLMQIFTLLRKYGLQPIGVLEGVLSEQAEQNLIAIFPKDKALQKIEAKSSLGNTSVYYKVLRSGQSLSHTEGDLILTQGSNNGAEVMASGNLHIYGKAQGRLLAGSDGEPSASIFCQYLEPTLVSIAGIYCLRDGIPEEMIGKAVHITLEKDKGLVFTQMNPDIK